MQKAKIFLLLAAMVIVLGLCANEYFKQHSLKKAAPVESIEIK